MRAEVFVPVQRGETAGNLGSVPHAGVRRRSAWANFWRLLRISTVELYRNNCLEIAKGAAYSGLLSFFPVLTTMAAILVQVNAEQVSRTISRFLYEVIPPGTEDVVRQLFLVKGERPVALLVGAVIVATWAAAGAIGSLMEGFRAIYHIPSGRGFVKDQSTAMLLVLLSVAPVWLASALIVLGSRSEQLINSWLGLSPAGTDLAGTVSIIGEVLRIGVAFCTFVLITALLYYIAPNRKQEFRRMFPGAALATVLWMLATAAFGLWVRHVARYNVLYGSAGAGLALVVWMYWLAVITLFGAQFNAVSERAAATDANGR
jgi:membrane protein